MSTASARGLSLGAHIRRLPSAGSVLYVRIDNSDISRLGLKHGQQIELNLGRIQIAGIVKTSGGSPWLAPVSGGSNAAITAVLRGARFEHGMDVSATMRLVDSEPEASTVASFHPARAVVQKRVSSHDGSNLRISPDDAVKALRDYNRGFYRGRSNIDLDRDAYDRFRNGLSNELGQLADQIAFVGERYGGAQERFLPRGCAAEAAVIARNLQRVMGQ